MHRKQQQQQQQRNKQANKQTNKKRNQSNENFENRWTQGPIICLSFSLDTVKPVTRALKKKLLLVLYVLVFKNWVMTGVRK